MSHTVGGLPTDPTTKKPQLGTVFFLTTLPVVHGSRKLIRFLFSSNVGVQTGSCQPLEKKMPKWKLSQDAFLRKKKPPEKMRGETIITRKN